MREQHQQEDVDDPQRTPAAGPVTRTTSACCPLWLGLFLTIGAVLLLAGTAVTVAVVVINAQDRSAAKQENISPHTGVIGSTPIFVSSPSGAGGGVGGRNISSTSGGTPRPTGNHTRISTGLLPNPVPGPGRSAGALGNASRRPPAPPLQAGGAPPGSQSNSNSLPPTPRAAAAQRSSWRHPEVEILAGKTHVWPLVYVNGFGNVNAQSSFGMKSAFGLKIDIGTFPAAAPHAFEGKTVLLDTGGAVQNLFRLRVVSAGGGGDTDSATGVVSSFTSSTKEALDVYAMHRVVQGSSQACPSGTAAVRCTYVGGNFEGRAWKDVWRVNRSGGGGEGQNNNDNNNPQNQNDHAGQAQVANRGGGTGFLQQISPQTATILPDLDLRTGSASSVIAASGELQRLFQQQNTSSNYTWGEKLGNVPKLAVVHDAAAPDPVLGWDGIFGLGFPSERLGRQPSSRKNAASLLDQFALDALNRGNSENQVFSFQVANENFDESNSNANATAGASTPSTVGGPWSRNPVFVLNGKPREERLLRFPVAEQLQRRDSFPWYEPGFLFRTLWDPSDGVDFYRRARSTSTAARLSIHEQFYTDLEAPSLGTYDRIKATRKLLRRFLREKDRLQEEFYHRRIRAGRTPLRRGVGGKPLLADSTLKNFFDFRGSEWQLYVRKVRIGDEVFDAREDRLVFDDQADNNSPPTTSSIQEQQPGTSSRRHADAPGAVPPASRRLREPAQNRLYAFFPPLVEWSYRGLDVVEPSGNGQTNVGNSSTSFSPDVNRFVTTLTPEKREFRPSTLYRNQRPETEDDQHSHRDKRYKVMLDSGWSVLGLARPLYEVFERKLADFNQRNGHAARDCPADGPEIAFELEEKRSNMFHWFTLTGADYCYCHGSRVPNRPLSRQHCVDKLRHTQSLALMLGVPFHRAYYVGYDYGNREILLPRRV
ncbi:unnamed protein product [Amoebophrya sp. A120]|nr:unnamed protein product [Amoebophrya sp. A120]|eukprot:GSA120T00010635001.1